MYALYCYIDFVLRTFDVKSKTSRRCFWVVFGINAALSALLTGIGLAIPQGRPLEIYIGISSIIATPLFIPFFTVIARRLNDAGKTKRWMWLLLIPGLGLVPLLVLCALPSPYGTVEDFSAYSDGAMINAVKKFLSSAMTIFPFIYLIFAIYKLATAYDTFTVGLGAAMLSVTVIICALTIAEARTAKFKRFLQAWKVVKILTALSSAILSIIFYSGAGNFIDSFFTVYLYFYVFISPLLLANSIYKLFKKQPEGQ